MRRPFLPLRVFALLLGLLTVHALAADDRPRIIIETDAGGDPDDEQSLVRFLVYANEFDVERIIANRAIVREGENRNPVRDGLVRVPVPAYRRVIVTVHP